MLLDWFYQNLKKIWKEYMIKYIWYGIKNKFIVLSNICASIQTKKLMLNLLKCRKAGTKCNKTPMSLLDRAEIFLLLAPGENVAMVYWVI